MRKRVAVILAASLALVGLAVANRHAVVHAAVVRVLGLATGYDVRLAGERFGTSHAALLHLQLLAHGSTVFQARRVDVWYSLRDLLPGARRRFGFVGIVVTRPSIALVRYADGTYDVPVKPRAPVLPQLPSAANPVPLRFFARVVDGEISVAVQGSHAAPLVLRGVQADGNVDSAARSHYVVTGLLGGSRRDPLVARGTVDVARGYAMHRVTAPSLPLAALANAIIDSKSVAVLAGTAQAFDARAFALGNPLRYQFSLGFQLRGGSLALPGLLHPVQAIGGRLALFDDVFFLRGLRAKLVGIPLRAEGSIFDFTHPQIRIGVTGDGEMARLRGAFRFSAHQALAGPLHLGILVEGALGDPTVVADAASPRMYYRGFPFEALSARVLYHHDVVAFAPLRFRYGGVTAAGRGSLVIGDRIRERMDLHFEAPANRLPYAGALLGSAPLAGDAALDGNDLRVDVTGSLAAQRGISVAAAVFDFSKQGVADVAPFWMRAGSGDVDGGFRLDRPRGTSAFWIDGERVSMRGANPANVLPQISLPQMPFIRGNVAHMAVVGGTSDGALSLAGDVTAGPLEISGVPFTALSAGFDGSLAGASIDDVRAAGPWGRFQGDGAFSGTALLANGAFDGSLAALRPVIGGVPAQGSAHGQLAIGIEPRGIFVQARGVRLDRASVDGVGIARADGTIMLRNDAVRVYSAHLAAAGGDVVAAGSFALRSTSHEGRLAFVATGLNAAALRPLGVPLDRGRVAMTGSIARGTALPTFDGEASLQNGGIGAYGLDGSAGIAFDGSRVAFDHVVAAMNGIYGYARGSVDGVTTGAPRFELYAVAPAGDVSAALHDLRVPAYGMQGTFDADLTVAGTAARPEVSGRVGVPAGSINGLPFLDAQARIRAGAGGVSANGGSVLVGTTRTAFDASIAGKSASLHVRAPSAAFSDFNNYFDTGDTLAGEGSIDVALATAASRVRTSGSIDVEHFRYRSLPIGDTNASWSSRRNVVRGRIAVGGAQGLLRAHGSVALAPRPDWQATLKRSRYDMSASVDDLDLGLWVSVLGFPQVPITGKAFGSATMVGTYPDLHLRGSAELRHGTLGRFPIDAFTLQFGSAGRRLAIESAHLQGPGITASASGSVGLHATDPISLRVSASTPDLPAFLAEITPVRVPLSGAFAGTLHVSGNFKTPVFDAALSAQNVHVEGVPVSTLFGSVRLQGNRLELYDAGASFTRGTARIAGDIPLHLAPLRVPENTPVHFTLDASDVDASVFDGLFGHDTKLGGTLSTHVSLSGTIEHPSMSGQVSVADGSYSSALDAAPITAAGGTLSFTGSQIVVQRLAARAGSGSVALAGRANLGGTSGATFNGTMTLRGAQFASPAYGSATIDGALSLARSTGNALLAGNVTMTNTTIPFAAFVGGAGGTGGAPASWPLAFNLQLNAGRNVRVRGSGYGAGLDISGTGAATLGGTFGAPTLDGSFTSTGGSLTYFDRAFRVLQGAVSFTPADGIIPTLHASATTTVVNPDPDVARNPFGSATINIAVDGPVDALKIDFTSDPSGYTREQLIALLAPFGGFISGIQFNPYEVQIPGGAAAVVNNAPVPGGVFVQRNGTLTVSQEAFSILNAQFASGLLAPVENVLGQTLGVSDVNLTLGYFGDVGISVRRVLGKTVSAVYSSTFGLPNRQSFGIRFAPNALNAAALSFFYQTGQLRLFQSPGEIFGPVLLGQPLEGQSGFSFSFEHFFR